MDTNFGDESDDYLLIDLYLEGWLDQEAMAGVIRRANTDAAFCRRAAVLLSLRQQAAEDRQDAASERAVRTMLLTIATERRPVSRLRHILREVAWFSEVLPIAAIVAVLTGLVVAVYFMTVPPGDNPTANDPGLVSPPVDSIRPLNNGPDQVTNGTDSLPKRTIPKTPPVLLAIRPLPIFVRDESDGSFGLGAAELATDTIPVRLFRVGGRAEYELRSDTLNLYLPAAYWRTKPDLHLNLEPDSTLTLTVNKTAFRLLRRGRQPLR